MTFDGISYRIAYLATSQQGSDCIGLDWTGFELKSSPSNSFRIWLLELQGNPMQIYTINSKSWHDFGVNIKAGR
jgi:hypothetical protein